MSTAIIFTFYYIIHFLLPTENNEKSKLKTAIVLLSGRFSLSTSVIVMKNCCILIGL